MGRMGHNGGPSMEPGVSWRRHCWAEARARLLPVLPVEVVRTRVRRAAALGLDYRTYAGVRAATGHDLVAFLFSSNALRASASRPAMPEARAAKLAAVAAGRLGLGVAPLDAAALAAANPVLDAAFAAPGALAGWAVARAAIRAALERLPGDRVLLVGDHGLEAEWCAAAGLAGYLPAGGISGEACRGRCSVIASVALHALGHWSDRTFSSGVQRSNFGATWSDGLGVREQSERSPHPSVAVSGCVWTCSTGFERRTVLLATPVSLTRSIENGGPGGPPFRVS
ncbi:MAG: hypothetical protein R3D63_01515 [Paracoccaceae bacterium]